MFLVLSGVAGVLVWSRLSRNATVSKANVPAVPAPAKPPVKKPAVPPTDYKRLPFQPAAVQPPPRPTPPTPSVASAPAANRPAVASVVTAPGPGAIVPREIRLPQSTYIAPSFTPDGSSLLYGGTNSIDIWNLADEKVVGTVKPAHWQYVLSPDGKTLATDMHSPPAEGRRPIIKIYDVATRQQIHELSRPADASGGQPIFRTCGFDTTSGKLFTRTDVDVQVWDVKTGKMLRRIALQKPPYNNGSAHSPNGRYLTIESGEATVLILDTQTEVLRPIHVGPREVGLVMGNPKGAFSSAVGSWSFSADERRVFGTCQQSGVFLEVTILSNEVSGFVIPDLLFAKVSSDGSRVLIQYKNDQRRLGVLDRQAMQVIATLGPMNGDISWYAISPDNRWVFVGGGNDSRLFDLGR